MNIFPGQTLPQFYDSFNRRFAIDNPFILVTLTLIMIVYYVIFKYLGVTKAAEGPPVEAGGIKMIEILMWALFIFLILINGLQYFFSLDIKATIKNLFAPVPEVEVKIEDKKGKLPVVPEIMIEKQVFNIPHQGYGYDDAKALCSAYGGRLASYNDIEKAYQRGAEWCNYGWSEGQMIFYPTQPATYEKYKHTKGRQHVCGRPGINGGYFKDKKQLFGVNCYGFRPEITPEEQANLGADNVPLTDAEIKFNEQVKEFRNNLSKVRVSSFNNNRWSQI